MKIRMFKLRINKQGYCDVGYYYGKTEEDIYYVVGPDYDFQIRASSRENAKEQVKRFKGFETVTFYR